MDLTPLPAMDDGQLGQYAENTARALVPQGTAWGVRVMYGTKKCLGVIEKARDLAGKSASPAAEWLLDNWYLIQREGRESAAAFRRVHGLRFVRREGRQPVVLELARAFVHAAGAETGAERLKLFLDHAQRALPLTELELALLIPALKCALAERLARACRGLDGEEDQQGLAAYMGAAFTALRTISDGDYGTLLACASRVESILGKDPVGVYGKMDEDTRRRYRQRVCKLARRNGISEFDMAEKVLRRAAEGAGEARHVGYVLFCDQKHRGARVLYVGGIVLATLFLTLLAGFWLDSVWAALLLLLPVSDVVKNCADFLAVRLLPPRAVHRLALEKGIPAQGRTLCVTATLLTSAESGAELAGLLEQYRLANRDAGPELRFGLLADLPDGDHPMGGREQEWVDRARESVEKLNQKYGGGFYLFFRTPVFHTPDERYMGWERKRGALVELVRLLKGRRTGIKVLAGDSDGLAHTRYVLTLDSDTALNVGAARELVGAMLHPLNRPRVDPRRGVVTSGYGLLQPRVCVNLEAANRSQFSRIFAGQGGVDPYGTAASDVYHDLFDEGTYTGKGIFDVDAFYTCLDRRFPRNAVLSHDLLEGAYLRAGLAGDVELADGYPFQVTAYFSRLHRWVRGDWQALPWLLRAVRNQAGEKVLNPISSMTKWKIFDNLRRSLSPVSTLLALLLGMCLSGPVFAFAAGAAILSAASNLLLSGAELAFRGGHGFADRYHAAIIAGFGGILLQTLVQLLFLPFQAWVCASAAVTALWRMGVTHRGLLAWTTAAESERKSGGGIWAYYHKMWPLAAVGFFCILCAVFPAGAAAGLVWAASPAFAWALSRPTDVRRGVAEADQPFLRNEAGLIWTYFCDFLRPEDHWLPPDNWQEQPVGALTRRTSPTNIGMALLCCLAAGDMDLCGRKRGAELIGHMLDSLERLSRWDAGHFYNWYDTSTAAPLEPRYVSTVDSGNLCGSLIALREGLREWGEASLAERAGALADAMDFSPLYDRSRHLFAIGYDCAKEAYTRGWYDLMASEARQTSFLAVARGEVEPRHWRRLSRMLVGQDHYSGMASWTGTMFEYFMPHLLLPVYQNSLLYESMAFCVYAQKKRAEKGRAPWGISESCFFAFDGEMNYQYKAHGVQRLGLKRGLDRELVVSPYSSFLALATAPRSAVKNLRRLRALGLGGAYGLCEAADFTKARLTGEKPFESVRTYMAHHLGMSLLSIDNALNGQIMQKRFLRDASMSAYRELLQEKVPVGARIMRRPRREIPEKPKRDRSAYRRPREAADVPCFLKPDDKLIFLTPHPSYPKDTACKAEPYAPADGASGNPAQEDPGGAAEQSAGDERNPDV